MSDLLIDSTELDKAFKDCFFKPEEIINEKPPGDAVIVEGIRAKFGFHPARLKAKRSQVIEWLKALPGEFHKGSGDGWSFLNACIDKNGQQWGEQISVEQLMCLGIGLGLVKYLLPRDMWQALPGSMPYFVITL